MYSRFQLALKYGRYYFSAANGKGHGIHSPFVFNFIKNVLRDNQHYDDYSKVEALRKKMLSDYSVIEVEDFGAGSSGNTSAKRKVAEIAARAAKSKKYGQLLYRMARHYKPAGMLELGTSLGITASYLAEGNKVGKLVTAEGSKEIAEKAKQNFRDLQLQNVEQVRGEFKYTLPMALYKLPTLDLAFIDGNHRREPTENYLRLLMEKRNANSIFIFDDIHWSEQMEQAWESIRQHPLVFCTVDLFFIGIVFFRKEFREKQHFTIRF
jgi:predicted O-methyltransferase YrrM